MFYCHTLLFRVVAFLLVCSGWHACKAVTARAQDAQTPAASAPQYVVVGDQDLQTAIDAAPAHSIILCDRNHELQLSTPIVVRKPLTLIGMHARLPESLGGVSLLLIQAANVTVRDFDLQGNADSVDQNDRAPLMIVSANDFCIENGVFRNCSKDGVMIDGDLAAGDGVTGGVVRDITGYNITRDVVSISGGNEHQRRIRNVLVENIRCYGSKLRGATEVSDGAEFITVRKIYAEDCVYAVDVQDHGKSFQVNSHVLLEDIYAKHCTQAVRTANHAHGHHDLTLRDVTADDCVYGLVLRNTDRLTLQNIRVLNHGRRTPVSIDNCNTVIVRDLVVADSTPEAAVLLVKDCNEVTIDTILYDASTNAPKNIVHVQVTKKDMAHGLRVTGVYCDQAKSVGVLLESASTRGGLTDYLIHANMASMEDRIQGARGVVIDPYSTSK